MEIKSRELLPHEAIEIEQELDPRDDLIRRLLEYKRYRDLARELEGRAERRSRQAALVLPPPPQLAEEDTDALDLGNVQLWDLTSAFARLLEEIGQQATMHVDVEKRDVGFYTRRLLDLFRRRSERAFDEVFERSEGPYGLIGTLVALLEMMKQGYVRATQEHCFGPVQVEFLGSDDVTAEQILAGITAAEERQLAREQAAADALGEPGSAAAPTDAEGE
jgi:segregation and condensation protein A